MEQVWDIFVEELHLAAIILGLKIHSFILMSNHFHLIASTPEANISECMHRLLGNVSRRLNEAGNRINGTFAGRHFKTILQHPNYFLNAYKYNYRNPVTAGLCERVEDYPFSTLYGLLGGSRLFIPVVEDAALFEDFDQTLKWLNQSPSPEALEAVRYGLKRSYFTSKKSPIYNRPVLTELDLM